MALDCQPVANVPTVNYQDYVLTQKCGNSEQPLFAYMNANLEIPGDGSTIAYMNASNSGSSNSDGGCSSIGGGCVYVA